MNRNRHLYPSLTFLFALLLPVAARAAEPGAELRQELITRRVRVMERMDPGSVLILFSGAPKNFSNDVFYPFRQENNLFYLTGINQPGITLVLIPGNERQREILFLPERDLSREVWTGRMLGREEAGALSGIDTIRDADTFEPFIHAVLEGRPYPRNGAAPNDYQPLFDAIASGDASVWLLMDESPERERERAFTQKVRDRFPGVQPEDATPIFRALRLIKSAYELRQLRQAIRITCEAHRKAMQTVRPGMYEYQIDGLIHATYRDYGAHWGFPSIVGSGPNATTLHYEANTRQMRDGELVLIDIGAAVGHYTADVTRTIPVNGRFTPEQRDIYEIVLNAQEEAIKEVRPGARIRDVNDRARAVVAEGLKRLGLITDTEGPQYRMWFMHGTSHWIGLDVHDVGGREPAFQPGMTLTVEPGIYIRVDALDRLEDTPENRALIEAVRPAFERYKHIGVRIEDDVLVTRDGYEILSDGAPRTIEAIERLMVSEAGDPEE